MAKKIATSVTHLIIDIPVGETTKVSNLEKAGEIKEKFEYIAKKYGIKIKVVITEGSDPVGKGVGPALEARDVLRVLQRKDNRPKDLEEKGLKLAAELLVLCGKTKAGQSFALAKKQLESGAAWQKMAQIIKAQGGRADIDSEEVTLGAIKYYVNSVKQGTITLINNQQINDLCRVLGTPGDKVAGIYLNKEIGEKVEIGERLYTLYARNETRLSLAKEAIKKSSIFVIK